MNRSSVFLSLICISASAMQIQHLQDIPNMPSMPIIVPIGGIPSTQKWEMFAASDYYGFDSHPNSRKHSISILITTRPPKPITETLWKTEVGISGFPINFYLKQSGNRFIAAGSLSPFKLSIGDFDSSITINIRADSLLNLELAFNQLKRIRFELRKPISPAP